MRDERWLAGKVGLGMALTALVMTSGSAPRLAAQRPAPRPASGPVAVPAGTPSAYKGIWESVSYPDDLRLMDVFFATADEGWVSGGAGELSGGLIIHTTDGGNHWEVQYGDPQSSEGGIWELRFLDQTHGWAVQRTSSAARLFHTRDGKNWILAGTMDEHHRDYMFTSENSGVQLSGQLIKVTADGGRSWKPVFECAAKIQIDGLWQNITCSWGRVQFLTSSIGYAIAVEGSHNSLLLAKTTDGGATWKLTISELTNQPKDVFFVDENTGYVRVGYPDTGQLFKTTDGGQTWTGMAASPGDLIKFADPEVGWAGHYSKISYTTDGGSRWNSREFAFPASVWTFSLPRRDRAYVVGDHGMIYRYRVVPSETVVAKALPAPAMPGIPTTLATDVTQLDGQFSALDGFVQSAPDAGNVGARAGGAPGAGAGGGVPSPGAPGGASGAAAGDFAQSAPSAFVAGCCGKRLSALELVLKAVGGIVPDFLAKYKNMNLLAQGLRTAAALPEMSDSLRAAFKTFRTAPDRPTAATALSGLKGILASLKAAVDTALQKPK